MSYIIYKYVKLVVHKGTLGMGILKELDDEINKLVLVHLFGVEVCHQEADIVSLQTWCYPLLDAGHTAVTNLIIKYTP